MDNYLLEQAPVTIRIAAVATCFALSSLSAAFSLSLFLLIAAFQRPLEEFPFFTHRIPGYPSKDLDREHGAAGLLLQKLQRTVGSAKVRAR